MKLKFKTQDFQTAAVAAVVDLFKGAEKRRDTFTITNESQGSFDNLGYTNTLTLTDEQITANMNAVQKRFSLPLTQLEVRSEKLGVNNYSPLTTNYSFSIEMETGTGKTYVYTKTIFELHKQYGFTKFIIVVPSVAIREGVYKSFQITAEHFAQSYDNAPARCFIYDSKKLANIRLFATSTDIEIMIINIDAFKKSENVINQALDRLSGDSAMSYIADTNPIVIIDEPQSVDNTPKAKEAISSLNPLVVLRFSATHREKINLLYRLTPVDAYQMGLVKQICVSSNTIDGDFNRPYIRVVSVSNENGFSAKIEIDKAAKSGKVERKTVTIKQGADIYGLSGERDLYAGYSVAGIDCTPGHEGIEFTNGEFLRLGKAMGDVDEHVIKRAQIRRTIEKHLEKELILTEKGIKVLSLFFIDEVAKYRVSSEKGVVSSGIYACMFEECYFELINLPKFDKVREFWHGSQLLTTPYSLLTTHNGYFSQDKKGNLKDTRGDTNDDYDTYNTIMKDKEWLLSFDCPLRFIFSHSALKEGWDNPNVFQVCTLIEQKSAFTCRQKVGRGLRLCVDQDGNRIEDRDINILHVMANESFAEFAENLQREIETETGVKFGVLQLSLFHGLTYTETVTEEKTITPEQTEQIVAIVSSEKLEVSSEAITNYSLLTANYSLPPALAPVVEKAITAATLGAPAHEIADKLTATTYTETREVEKSVDYEGAAELLTHFRQKGYVTKSGAIKDTMKAALAAGTLDLPAKFEAARERFETVIKKADQKPVVHDAAREVRIRLKKQVLLSPEFLMLWDKIKGRTAYRVSLDENELAERCIRDLAAMERVSRARVVTKTARYNIDHPGVDYAETELRAFDTDGDYHNLPDFIRVLDDECFLSRKTAVEILRRSGRLGDFLNNPQRMTEMFVDAVRHVQNGMEIDGIRYIRLDGEEYYLQEIFGAEELTAYLDKNAIAVENSVYDHVIYDSDTVERPFAVALDSDPDVKLFFKIPSKFQIETPIGTYNPDWAVYVDKDGVERLYFVLETKGTTRLDDLRGDEARKIICGKRHFAALDSDVIFPKNPVMTWKEVKTAL